MIRMIVARSRNGVIGADGQIPWRLRNDMRFFRATTEGHAIIMGRKTFESIGRPLPNRRNIVLTRDPAYTALGVTVVHSPEEALRVCDADAFVIGGQQVYDTFLPFADELFITEVDAEVEGETIFPDPVGNWKIAEVERHGADEHNQYPHVIYLYTRQN